MVHAPHARRDEPHHPRRARRARRGVGRRAADDRRWQGDRRASGARRAAPLRGDNNGFIDGEIAEMARDSARSFARREVAPIAERIHRHDELVPESIIRRMAELGYFGMSVPEEYGGQGIGNLVMIVITEELSAASLAAAGSLITRPEILTKALLKGGAEAQKRKWLPPAAAGGRRGGVSVTQPGTRSHGRPGRLPG